MALSGSRRVARGARGSALAVALAGSVGAGDASAQDGLLPPSGAFVDSGRLRPAAEREHERGSRVCSLRHPLCVHGESGELASGDLLALVAAAEGAWDVETGALELPAPEPDLLTGAYDLYVVRGVPEGTVTVAGSRDPRSTVDRTSAFTLFDASLATGDACERDAAVAASVARASLFRVAPATDEGSARAEAAYVARLAVPCAMGRTGGIEVFQRRPDRAFMDDLTGSDARESARFADGASLFYWWLDASYSATPGGLVRAIWALSPTVTPPGAERWKDEPDGIDVLRESFKEALSSGSRLEDLFAEFGTTRALLGPADNGAELVEARPLGAALAPRIDWTIDWPQTARRLASPYPLAPTGSSYVLVRHAGAPSGSRLRIEAEWEQHAAIRWTAVKLDAAGREIARIPIAAAPRATEAQGTIVDLDGADAVLVVATNVGDPFVKLEPDDERFEPHGWLVTLAAE
jgi:hypothetical protein